MELRNWDGSVVSRPAVIAQPLSVDEVVTIVKDRSSYPSPVRAIGSSHSTTRCTVADGGTVLDMRGMDRILQIDRENMLVRVQAGATYIQVAKALLKEQLQFHVNTEIGNITIGSAACCATKDGSMPGEYGQISSYCVAMRVVTPTGDDVEITEEDADRMKMMRSSYGLLGIVCEATFRVCRLRSLAVYHQVYKLDDFANSLPQLRERGQSMMMYLFPFQKRVAVEFREYKDTGPATRPWLWWIRNRIWASWAPGFSYIVTALVPVKTIRYFLIEWLNLLLQWGLGHLLHGSHTVPTDQIIHYPERAGWTGYSFSFWAFPENRYIEVLRAYIDFSKAYYRSYGYRTNCLDVGYRVQRDENAHFSYSRESTVMTLDPVSTADPGWEDFLVAFNEFCSRHGGRPTFNQTKSLTPGQVHAAFGEVLPDFIAELERRDPERRMLSHYFASLFGLVPESPA